MAEDIIDLEAELDRLYGLPAGEFVAARNALGKRLRKAGDRDAADRTKKLPRPSVTAWAVNQLAFRASAELDGLRAAGETVRTAHLAGPKEQQAAARARRAAISTLRVIAEVALQEVGVSPTRVHRQRIGQTLEVLSSQGSEADQPRAGRLSADLEPAGFDALTDLAAALAASQQARPPVASKPKQREVPLPRPRVVEHPSSQRMVDSAAGKAAARKAAERRALERRRAQAQAKLEPLEGKVAGLLRDAERAASALDGAKGSEAGLADAARVAERRACEARSRLEAAAGLTAQARRDADSARGALRRAEAEIEKAREELTAIESTCRELED